LKRVSPTPFPKGAPLSETSWLLQPCRLLPARQAKSLWKGVWGKAFLRICLASCQSMSNAERQRGQAMPVLRTGWPNSRSPVRVGACCPAERRIGPVAGPWHCLPAEPELGLLFSSGQDDRPKRSAEGRQHPTLRPVGRTSCGRPLHRRSSRHRESRPGETHEGGPHAKHIRTSRRLPRRASSRRLLRRPSSPRLLAGLSPPAGALRLGATVFHGLTPVATDYRPSG
jgi:hypothetical protein